MTGAADFTKLVPGFDFLQNLMKGAAAGLPQAGGVLPQLGQWIAPTLDPAELEKRIQDLKTVQFWLEQNSRLLGTTIQALEVQRMTLSTLKSMNLPLADLGAALRAQVPTAAEAPAPAPAPVPVPTPEAPAEPAATAAAAPAIDPMQWWGALTQQFSEIAAQALRDQPVVGLAQPGQQTAKPRKPPRAAAPPASPGKTRAGTGTKASRKTSAKASAAAKARRSLG